MYSGTTRRDDLARALMVTSTILRKPLVPSYTAVLICRMRITIFPECRAAARSNSLIFVKPSWNTDGKHKIPLAWAPPLKSHLEVSLVGLNLWAIPTPLQGMGSAGAAEMPAPAQNSSMNQDWMHTWTHHEHPIPPQEPSVTHRQSWPADHSPGFSIQENGSISDWGGKADKSPPYKAPRNKHLGWTPFNQPLSNVSPFHL